MQVDLETHMRTVWAALEAYCEVGLGSRTGNGVHDEHDDDHAEEWADICHAMAVIREELGLPNFEGEASC